MQRPWQIAAAFGLVALLAGCQLSLPGRGGGGGADTAGPGAIAGDVIATSRLDAPAPAGGAAGPATAGPASPTPPATAGAAPPGAATAPDGGPDPAGAALAPVVPPPAATPPAVTPPVPEALKPPEQISCERRGGLWMSVARSAARTCVMRMRDAGRKCSQKSDCQGQCLARSGTCAPVDPLFGCNEVLERGSRRVTICLD